VKKTEINMGVQVSLLYTDLHSFSCIPRSGIAGSAGRSLLAVLFLVFFEELSYCFP
jgi:hypothetical protein